MRVRKGMGCAVVVTAGDLFSGIFSSVPEVSVGGAVLRFLMRRRTRKATRKKTEIPTMIGNWVRWRCLGEKKQDVRKIPKTSRAIVAP